MLIGWPPRPVVLCVLALVSVGCRTGRPVRGRSEPVCAVQDCATGRILDDGCADDGRCASCVNACAPAPSTPPSR